MKTNPFPVGVCLENTALAGYSHLRVGGQAQYVLAPRTWDELGTVLRILQEEGIAHRLIGGGSNILFPEVYPGAIVLDSKLPVEVTRNGDTVRVTANANLNRVMMELALDNYGGLEFLAGVPAHVGGALRMNAGAFGKSMQDIVKGLTTIDASRTVKRYGKDEISFGYRQSGITGWILEAELQVEPNTGVRAAIRQNIEIRRQKQPLQLPNLGCFFKNPVGQSAGALIDRCGLKGVHAGDAMVSPQHANFIVNLGRARTSDVLRLIERVRCCVLSRFGVELELEIEVVK